MARYTPPALPSAPGVTLMLSLRPGYHGGEPVVILATSNVRAARGAIQARHPVAILELGVLYDVPNTIGEFESHPPREGPDIMEIFS